MRKAAQIAFSGLSGASDVCAALAIAGQKAGVRQTVAFWGTEPVVEARVKRCADVGIETAAFPKNRGIDSAGQPHVALYADEGLRGDVLPPARAKADAPAH